MNEDKLTQPSSTDPTPQERQDGDKTEKPPLAVRTRIKVRSGEGTAAYWRAKLFRNTYRDRQGRTVEQPEYYVRLRHGGITRRVRLKSSDKDNAAEQALQLSRRLQAEGWSAVDEGKARLPSTMTPEKFCEEYEEATKSMERPPRPITIALYVRHFRRVCKLAGVEQLRQLTPAAIEVARDRYRSEARKAGTKDPSNALGMILRNAAACFSREALAIFARKGLKLTSPFSGIRRSQRMDPVTPLHRDILNRISDDLPKLRDGDPQAEPVDKEAYRRKYRKAHGNRPPRLTPFDWRKPHPEAYCAIILALGLGLRANEVDKARWSWIQFDRDGKCLLEIREEDEFKAKGGTKRFIRVRPDHYDALVKARADLTSPYIIGGSASSAVQKRGWGYRSVEVFRVANSWLRERGVETGQKGSKPLHRLRKQFGSEVATNFGLFAAQKLLGHASPAITAKYYAAQTELPELTHLRLA